MNKEVKKGNDRHIQTMVNPFTQFKFAFELWVASVFGIYSQDFYDWNEWLFADPKYTQENLTGRFWQELNDGWEWIQPYMIEAKKRFDEETYYETH